MGGRPMWGQDKQNGKHIPDKEGTEDIIAFVGRGVEFKGIISYSGTVRIDGSLEGEIRTDGTLLIGEDAVIQAKVSAGTIVCKGKITGDVVAKESMKLHAPAVITGSVNTPVLSMESGVFYNGGLQMSQDVHKELPGATAHALGAVVAEAIGITGV
jgi:cytoskeletal protein CcmA (bactofilin family)